MAELSPGMQPRPVGPVLLPPMAVYVPKAASSPISAPAGQPVAQLAEVPQSLSEFIGVEFPPFGPPPRVRPVPRLQAEQRIFWEILGVVDYRGREGRILVSTVRPSSAAARAGLALGDRVGRLPNGVPLFEMIDGEFLHQVRWLEDGYILAVTGDLGLERLIQLAATVVLVR